MFTVGRVVNHREDQKSIIFHCIYLPSNAMYHCNWAPSWAPNIVLFFSTIFKLKSKDWNVRLLLLWLPRAVICQLWGHLHHNPLKKKFKTSGSKTAIPCCCHSSSFPQRSLLFWAALKEAKCQTQLSLLSDFWALPPNLDNRKLFITF